MERSNWGKQNQLEGHEAPVYCVCPHFKENIQFIFSTATDGNIKAWLYDNVGSRLDYAAPGLSPSAMAYSDGGTRLFSCGTNKEGQSFMVEWNESEGAIKRMYNGLGKRANRPVQFDTTKNRYIVAGDEWLIKYWNMDNASVLLVSDAEGGLPASPCVRFNLEGILLAVSTSDNGIKILANSDGVRVLKPMENRSSAVKVFFYQLIMDISFDGLISSDAANTAKGGIKFQPKGKPKPKPKPKPNAQPEPKPTPPPSTQLVEVAASTAEQTGDDVNQIIGNIVDSLQSSFEKSPEENAEAGITLDSPNDFLPESSTATVTPALDVSVDGKLAAGPTEPELITNIDDSTTLKSIEALDPLTGEKGAIYNDNDGFQIGNLSSGSKEVEDAIFWEPNILDQSGPRVSKFKPKPKAQTRKLEQIANNPDQDVGPIQHGENIRSIPSQTDFVENEPAPSFTPERISDYHVNEESISLTELSQMDPVNQTRRSSKRSRRLTSKALQIIDEVEIEGIDVNNDDYVPENETIDDENESKSKSKSKAKKPLDENKKTVRKRKKDKEVSGDLTEVPKKKFSHSTKRNKRPVNPELLTIPEDEFELHMHNFPLRDLIRLREHKERIEKKEASLAGTNANDESNSAQNTNYYNYRTHMKITPRMKWTKQDTELFYEAVQQFGSDFSIIAECFPGRTREQIKSKFKKEFKQHRLRMESALNTRVKGLSRFEYVLERLKQARGEDSENDNDDPGTSTGEDGVQEADDNNEGGLEKQVKDMKADESPIKADDDIEDDDDTWNQYTGDI